jgi:hypothetical protein
LQPETRAFLDAPEPLHEASNAVVERSLLD